MKRQRVRVLLAYWLGGYLGTFLAGLIYFLSLMWKHPAAPHWLNRLPALLNFKLQGMTALMGVIWPLIGVVAVFDTNAKYPWLRFTLLPSCVVMFICCHALLGKVLPRRMPRGLCEACGYDLRATPQAQGPLLSRCPECGKITSAEPATGSGS